MKKFILFLCSLSGLYGVDGADVYEQKCKSCHLSMASRAEFASTIAKAPPMVAVSTRLRNAIVIKGRDNSEEIHRFTVISFIKEYMKNPSWDYYMCDHEAINRFGFMPPQTDLTEEESQAVAEWIYDYFEDKKFE